MPKRESAPAGDYVLTGIKYRRRTKAGGWEIFDRGDIVPLSADEAARHVGRPHSSFRIPPDGPTSFSNGNR